MLSSDRYLLYYNAVKNYRYGWIDKRLLQTSSSRILQIVLFGSKFGRKNGTSKVYIQSDA